MNIHKIYPIIRSGLFCLDAEKSHEITLEGLQFLHKFGLLKKLVPSLPASKPVNVMGLNFINPIGLAAGLDKTGQYIDALSQLGFGFIEVGTVTPKPQSGNDKPRLFRIPSEQAVINRMGFNNVGLDQYLTHVKNSTYVKNGGIIGLNIGKNAATPIENSLNDYTIGLQAVYPYASYVTINISSPNTPNLRQLQQGDSLSELLNALKTQQQHLATQYQRYVPIVVKVAPDLSESEIHEISNKLIQSEIDGLIATNTTISRPIISSNKTSQENGGLSGKPLLALANQVLSQFAEHLSGKIPIIGVGGITDGKDALNKLQRGASLVQLYSGLIFKGPQLVHECIQATNQSLNQ